MAETLQKQLENVQSAIAAIESGNQSYSIGGAIFTKANLQTLYDREQRLLNRIAAQAGMNRTLAEF